MFVKGLPEKSSEFRKNFNEFGAILIACCLFLSFKYMAFIGWDLFWKSPNFIAPLMDSVLYAPVCYFIFLITIRIAKSPALFLFVAAAFAACSFHRIIAGPGFDITSKVVFDVYVNGKVTPYGIIYKSISIPNAMLFFAASLFSFDVFTNHIKQK